MFVPSKAKNNSNLLDFKNLLFQKKNKNKLILMSNLLRVFPNKKNLDKIIKGEGCYLYIN